MSGSCPRRARLPRAGGIRVDHPSPAVLYEKVDGGRVALVTLNRPRALNAYNVEMRDALYEALQAVRDDSEVRVMLLQGNGRAFSTGGDVTEFGTAPSPVAARAIRWQRDVWGTLWSLPVLTLAVVQGYAAGGGFEMAMLCDQCLASDNARFGLPETGLGMIPGVGGTQTLPRLLGQTRAMDLVLTGRWIDAREAKRLGIVTRVIDTEGLRQAARRAAGRLATIPPLLAVALKRAVNDGLDCPLSEGLALERLAVARC